jgi:hypothetical protein
MATGLILAAVLASVGCGGGGSSGSTGLDGTKQISAANDADKASLCDWFAAQVGGYGSTPACADALLKAPPSKDDCLATFPSCAVTVADFQSCIEMVVSAQAACTQDALAAAQADANCQMVANAGCFN